MSLAFHDLTKKTLLSQAKKKTETLKIKCGVPQGSVLEPLFILFLF